MRVFHGGHRTGGAGGSHHKLSRTRVTAMMSRNTKDISTDLMLRVLGALGVTAKVTFGRAA